MFAKQSICLFAFLACFTLNAQQISIDDSLSVQDLIDDNLIRGCVEISNTTSTVNGQVNGFESFAYFERAGSNFPFESGIMLSTGKAISGGNTLNTSILNDGHSDWLTDPDLESALGISGTLNATSVEFDVISVTNQIQFNYILASEEYFGNFPCDYSDGFAFLIKEAGTTDPYVNLALIPGTSTAVNTNTIHPNIAGFCEASNEEYFAGYNVGDTNFNGRTTVMTASATIEPNVQYHIKLIIADQNDRSYDSAVFIEGNSFESAVNLGSDIETCADMVHLNGDIGNTQATYSWFLNNSLLANETQPTLNATQSGDYRVEVEIPLGSASCITEDTVNIVLSSTQSAEPIADFELCDDSIGDEIEIFDLSTKDEEVYASVPESSYSISYHLTAEDAENSINSVSSEFQNTSNPQTIYVRIEDEFNGCLAFQSFDLIVNPLPNPVDVSPLIVCDDNVADGFTAIDLSVKDDEFTNGDVNLSVTYYLYLEDAENGTNAIPLPYVNTNVTETVFVQVSNLNTGCFITSTLDIEVLDNPSINLEDRFIEACDSDLNGQATFDLTTIIDDVLEGLTGVNVSFHETQEDANLNTNPIADSSNYANIINNVQIIFIRVEDELTGCASTTPIELHTNLLLTATDIRNISKCDVDNDGIETFSFEEISEIFIDDVEDIMDYDVDIKYYLTEIDRDNDLNEINPSVPFIPTSNPQTIFISLTSPFCQEFSEFNLVINPIIEFEPIDNQTVCDTDQDGFTPINLSSFNTMVTNNITSGFNVTYFPSFADAEAGTNALPNIYTNTSNPQTVYSRILANNTGCFDINSFEIEVLPAPLSSQPSGIVICDDDQDGISLINLATKISETVTSTTNRLITFHTSQNNANNAVNSITNIGAYPAVTETIFIRIENTITGCFSTESFNVIVNTIPLINPIEIYVYCESGSDGFGEFIFATQDSQILNGQTGKVVFYFETAEDALNNTNPIDKNNVYVNTSDPQTIYYRIENVTDSECFSVSSFPIEVETNPTFNEPSDSSVCDDDLNDGIATFDLNVQMTEISEGIPDIQEISFHTSQFNAENNINPLPLNFENTFNPQQIYARINNGSLCESYVSFVLNVISAPSLNPSQSLVQCDSDYNGIVVFDLTLSEIDLLDERPEDIEISYYETEDDLFLETNEITDPTNYTNLSNPQTIFVRATNTIYGCFSSVPLALSVNLPPVINPISSFDACDNDTNSFNLTDVNSTIQAQTNNVLVSYYASEEDARNDINELDSDYTYLTNNDLLFARVEFSTTGCFIIHAFNLNVNPLPVANQPENLITCDDNDDGFFEFNLTQQNSEILGDQNPNMFTVSYYLDAILAEEGADSLGSTFEALNNDIIYVRVENNATGCYNTTQFMTIVLEKPVVDIDNQVICLDNLPLTVSANTNNPGDSYVWSTNETTSEIDITEVGTYSVTVTSFNGCETTRVFTVSESEAANIEVTETVDFSDPNNITVTVSGIGNYMYQLDDEEPQISSVFENVSLGYHTITIIDLNGCSEVSKEIVVIDAPKFFTPNNDSYFDTWHITGVETLTGTVVYIYDRYGKLLKTLNSNDKGWDGFYNGQLMRSSDYWFVADVKKENIQFQVKGHFSLRL